MKRLWRQENQRGVWIGNTGQVGVGGREALWRSDIWTHTYRSWENGLSRKKVLRERRASAKTFVSTWLGLLKKSKEDMVAGVEGMGEQQESRPREWWAWQGLVHVCKDVWFYLWRGWQWNFGGLCAEQCNLADKDCKMPKIITSLLISEMLNCKEKKCTVELMKMLCFRRIAPDIMLIIGHRGKRLIRRLL